MLIMGLIRPLQDVGTLLLLAEGEMDGNENE